MDSTYTGLCVNLGITMYINTYTTVSTNVHTTGVKKRQVRTSTHTCTVYTHRQQAGSAYRLTSILVGSVMNFAVISKISAGNVALTKITYSSR